MLKLKALNLRGLTLFKITRVHNYLEEFVEKKSLCPLKEQKRIDVLYQRFRALRNKARFLATLRTLFYAMLYLSIFSALFSKVPVFDFLAKTAVFVTSLVGAAVFLSLISIFNKLIDLLTNDAYMIAMTIVAIIVKYEK